MKRVLIIGRPNVGKSSLFNRLVKQRKALVVNQPGVTRDILKQKASWWGCDFEVWDSGGVWSGTARLGGLIDKKVFHAINESDLLLLVLDARSGYVDEDKAVFRKITKSGKPFLVLVNKIDELKKTDIMLSGFHTLGVELLPCAFEEDKGVAEVVEWIIDHSPKKPPSIEKTQDRQEEDDEDKEEEEGKEKEKNPIISLLIAGKINVGKSTLCNALLRQERVLTSPMAGTTLDVVEDYFQYGTRSYMLVDTAGVRKTSHVKGKKESLAQFKTQQYFRKGDLVLLLLDATVGPSHQEARLLELCMKEHKACILVVNKWDLMSKETDLTKDEYRKSIYNQFRFYANLPIVFTSSLEKTGLSDLLKKVNEIYDKLHISIRTSQLNNFLVEMTRSTPSPVYGSQDVKFYYFTQTSQNPPSFLAFANYPKGVKIAYRRFLIRQIQTQWNLQGIPINISIRSRHKK